MLELRVDRDQHLILRLLLIKLARAGPELRLEDLHLFLCRSQLRCKLLHLRLCFGQTLLSLQLSGPFLRLLVSHLQLLVQIVVHCPQSIHALALLIEVLFVLFVVLLKTFLFRLHFLHFGSQLPVFLLNLPDSFLDLQRLFDFRKIQLLFHLSMLLLCVFSQLS